MIAPLPPELAEKIREIAARHCDVPHFSENCGDRCVKAILEAYPWICAYVARRVKEILSHEIVDAVDVSGKGHLMHAKDVIERELGGKDEQVS